MPIYRRIIAHFYDHVMRHCEKLCLSRWRTELLADLHGVVIEIGAGTGLNLAHYPPNLSRLILCEPDDAMRSQLRKKLSLNDQRPAEIQDCAAEALNMPDGSVDFLVATLVLCSVDRPHQAMSEAFRVLKPGGSLVFLEHVAATGQPGLLFWQGFWQPLWKRLACNCHLRRETAEMLRQAGFVLNLRNETLLGAPKIATPLILGCAVKPLLTGDKP
jgi:ubiquinone/menaquinone biosynthesis C-methylase UbiE